MCERIELLSHSCGEEEEHFFVKEKRESTRALTTGREQMREES
jgi:hypothetical protein